MKELVAPPWPQEQKVRITSGPFREFIGTLEGDGTLDRELTVVLSIFGRPARVKVTREQIENV